MLAHLGRMICKVALRFVDVFKLTS